MATNSLSRVEQFVEEGFTDDYFWIGMDVHKKRKNGKGQVSTAWSTE